VAAPAYRGHQTASVVGTTLTINKPSGTTSGDLLIAHVQHVTGNLSSDPTPPSGAWTLLGARQANSSSTQWWFWAVAGGSEPASYDWTGLSSGAQTGSITAVSGADTTSPFHQTHQLQQTNISGTSVALTVTTTIADCLLWASASIDAGEVTTFSQASMTERWDETLTTSDLCHAGYTAEALTAGTYARTISYSPAQRCAGTLLAIAPASGSTAYSLSASGTGTTGGAAPLTLTMPLSAAGAAATAGGAALNFTLALTASGSAATSGSAALGLTSGATTHDLSATGATTSSGAAALSLQIPMSAAGASATTGAAALGIAAPLTAAGTATTDGSAALSLSSGPVTHSLTASGAATSSGGAILTERLALTASGSATTAGSAALDLTAGAVTYALSADGSAASAGSALLTAELVLAGSGAATSSGSSPLSLSLSLSADGVAVSSGGADLTFFAPTTERPNTGTTLRPTAVPLSTTRPNAGITLRP